MTAPRPRNHLALPPPPAGLSRRGFLGLVAAGVAAGAVGCSSDGGGDGDAGSTATTSSPPPAVELGADPFTLGVASGDPLDTSVILWTRLAIDPLAPDGTGGMPDVAVPVTWRVVTDDSAAQVVASGTATADPALGHSVHVDATGLEPATWYTYVFEVGDPDHGGFRSPMGRTRTLPAPGAEVDRFAFAFGSCQNWQAGYFSPYPHLAEEDLDLVVFLGDYIYENGPDEEAVRQHDGPEIFDLAAYRNRYALYKGDAGLQAAHAALPWIATWDDHEVDNNYADDVHEGGDPPEEFLARRAAAYQAYYEHLPLRVEPPEGPDLRIFRSFDIGALATLFVLDTRQERDDQVCDDGSGLPAAPRCDDAEDPARTILGDEQRTWLTEGVEASTTAWNVVANQVVLTDLPIAGGLYNMDQWDGYVADRRAVLDSLAASSATPIVVTGDIHLAGAAELKADWADPSSATIGVELVGTSISSQFPLEFAPVVEAVADAVPYVAYVNATQRGYCMVELTPDAATATYRVVDSTATPDAAIATDATFTIPRDDPGLERA